MLEQLAEIYRAGGIFMYINTGSSVAALAIIVERVFQMFFRYNLNAPQFMVQIEKLVYANNIDRAIKLCNAAPAAALSKVIRAGLTRANRGTLEISAAIEEATLEATPHLLKRIGSLWSLANIATLLGLLGTITGLIRAFAAVGMAAPDQKSRLLTQGISEAMNNTAFGLGIAVTCIIGHMFLSGMAKKITDDIEFYSVKLENILMRRATAAEVPGGAAPAEAPKA